MSDERRGIDDLSTWLGIRWEAFDRVRLTIGPEHMNGAGLLAGPVGFAMVDYCMGSTLWKERVKGEGIATTSLSINYVQTAREGDILCTCKLDRRNDRTALLSAEIRHDDDQRLLATAIGAYAIFPKDRLQGRDTGMAVPEGTTEEA